METACTCFYRTVKNFGGQKFGKKGYCKALAKKLWRMLNCIANYVLINSKTAK